MYTYAFWCEHAYAIYSMKPIIDKYKKKGYNIIFFTENSLIPIAKKYLKLNDREILSIKAYKSPIGRYLTLFFQMFFIPINYSEFYYQRQKIKLNKTQQRLSQFFKIFNLPKEKVNQYYIKLFCFLYKMHFIKKIDIEFDRLYVFTKLYNPYILAPFSKKMILIMESWDHPSKEPFLANPICTLSWNRDLINEIKYYQFYSKVFPIKPLKFRYIEDFLTQSDSNLIKLLKNQSLIDDLQIFENEKVAVYPMCTSSTYFAFNGEIKFIKDLSVAVKIAGYVLYVRPYPLAPVEDCKVIQSIENVVVGFSDASTNGTDVLNQDLQIHKYLLLRKATLIINTGTTFVFDAALVGAPIIQLGIYTDKYSDFSNFSKGLHIQRYLLNNNLFKSFEGNIHELAKFIEEDMAFSTLIRKWLQNKGSEQRMYFDHLKKEKLQSQ